MLTNFAVYITATGQVNRIGSCDSTAVSAQAQTGETAVDTTTIVVDPATQYYLSGVLTARPLMTSVATWDVTSITANGTSTATLGFGLPNPTTVNVTASVNLLSFSQVYRLPPTVTTVLTSTDTVTTGSFLLKTEMVGEYEVTAIAFPYQSNTVIITGT